MQSDNKIFEGKLPYLDIPNLEVMLRRSQRSREDAPSMVQFADALIHLHTLSGQAISCTIDRRDYVQDKYFAEISEWLDILFDKYLCAIDYGFEAINAERDTFGHRIRTQMLHGRFAP